MGYRFQVFAEKANWTLINGEPRHKVIGADEVYYITDYSDLSCDRVTGEDLLGAVAGIGVENMNMEEVNGHYYLKMARPTDCDGDYNDMITCLFTKEGDACQVLLNGWVDGQVRGKKAVIKAQGCRGYYLVGKTGDSVVLFLEVKPAANEGATCRSYIVSEEGIVDMATGLEEKFK